MSADDAKSDLEKMTDCSYICQWWIFAEKGVMSWGNVILMLHGAGMLMPSYITGATAELFFLREFAEARRDLDERIENIQQRLVGDKITTIESGVFKGLQFFESPRQHGKSILQQAIADSSNKKLDNSLSQSIIKLFDIDQGGRK